MDKMDDHYPIVVIGAGAGGLVVAIGAAKAGKKVLLIDKGTWGGDCTNFGCIPSKSTIASAHVANCLKEGKALGIQFSSQAFNAKEALNRTRLIVGQIRSHEEPKSLEKLGVHAKSAVASFLNDRTLKLTSEHGEQVVTATNIVIASGSRPRIPDIPGLKKVNYLTNETIFDLLEPPKSLICLGGGPIGSELAQAYLRLGSDVSLIQHREHLLTREPKCAQEVIENTFQKEGMRLFLNTEPISVSQKNEQITLIVRNKKTKEETALIATHLLISAGRVPNLEKLKLENAGIHYTRRGITRDEYARTNKPHIFAIGDVAGRATFTHLAENEGRTVLTTLLMPGFLKKKLDLKQPIPRSTFTDPEVASVGLLEEEAENIYGKGKIATYTVLLKDVDRAITSGRVEGFVQIVTKKWSSKILGATVVSPNAGDMLMEISTAMHGGIPLRKLSTLIHPYPIYNLAIRKAADKWLIETVIPSLKKIIGK